MNWFFAKWMAVFLIGFWIFFDGIALNKDMKWANEGDEHSTAQLYRQFIGGTISLISFCTPMLYYFMYERGE